MKQIVEFIKTQVPFEIKRPSSLISIIIALIITGFCIQIGATIFDAIIDFIAPYTPALLKTIIPILTFSVTLNLNLISVTLFILGFFTTYRLVDRKILQKIGDTKIFEDDFDSGNFGWQLNYWGSNNPDKTCRYENSFIVFEAEDNELIDNRKEFGAYYDLSTGIYEGSKYVISCWVKAEENTNMGFKLWVHDTNGRNELKFPARFYTPGTTLEEVKVGFTGSSSQALRIHLHNKAGSGKILVEKVVVTKVRKA